MSKEIGRGNKKKINKNQFEELCKIQCTQKEICDVLGTTDKTLLKWIADTYNGAGWAEVYGRFKSHGKASLRRKQFEMAGHNPTLAIWLGKQYLDQTDSKQELAGNLNVVIVDDV